MRERGGLWWKGGCSPLLLELVQVFGVELCLAQDADAACSCVVSKILFGYDEVTTSITQLTMSFEFEMSFEFKNMIGRIHWRNAPSITTAERALD